MKESYQTLRCDYLHHFLFLWLRLSDLSLCVDNLFILVFVGFGQCVLVCRLSTKGDSFVFGDYSYLVLLGIGLV